MDDEQLKIEAFNFYSNLYREHPGPRKDFPSSAFPRLNDGDLNFLSRPVTDEEIKKALFCNGTLKGSREQWVSCPVFSESVGACWELGQTIDLKINKSLIVLIPKVQNPEEFSQFRPISLSSVLYKLVMKVIINCFKVVFPRIIAPEQIGFIVGRNITDNIVIAQEIHPMRCNKKNRKLMAIKIDLEKADDRVLRNGIPTHSIHNTIEVRTWSPIRLARDGPLSHIFFPDDLILFGHANDNQAQIMKNILEAFCAFLGHRVNM
ncbi:reverse transcriptase [Gossypium australe]|uniref:Reverse transcriptase n=1 Tax=Gossypium australe TaxID=47621 RepID=A0A5B6X1S8_9ROSI|nr:reverse transcriptase [Gossypium australe]